MRGREKAALDLFNETVQYYGRLQQEGKIERFDPAVLTPTGGDVGGFSLLRRTAQQIDSLRRDEEYQRMRQRFVGPQRMNRYEKVVGQASL